MKRSLAMWSGLVSLVAMGSGCGPVPGGAHGDATSGTSGDTTSDATTGDTTSGPSGGSGTGGNSGTGSGSGGTGGDMDPSEAHSATFRTFNTGQFLSAGGAALNAGSKAAGKLETFTLVDLNGGALVDGDEVHLAAASGLFVSAVNGGGGTITVDAKVADAWETFVILRVAGPGEIGSGDQIALQTKVTGNYVSAIDGGGGDVLANAPWIKAWEKLIVTLDGKPGPVVVGRQKVLDYLAGISGKGTVVGIENKDASKPTSDSDEIESITGKTPGFWSADWGFGSWAVDNRQTIVDEGIAQWNKGAIVQYIYHVCPLTQDELCSWDDIGGANPKHLSDAQWNELITPGTKLHDAWLARLDTLSGFFQQLKDAGVAPLFRVLHEMNQGVFWWAGRSGPNGTAKLFQITHDYLVNDKGFDNIIWVWNLQDFESLSSDVGTYSPGAAYFDIAALDVYNTGYTTGNYEAMKSASAGKPIGIGECQFMPTADLLAKQPLWTYAALWPDFTAQNADKLPALFSAPNVITLGQMPGWK